MPYYGHRDPREGEHPEEADICPHNQLRESCGRCHDDEIHDALLAGELEPAQAEDALRVFFRNMLDRINADGGRR